MSNPVRPHLIVGCGYLGRRVADRWRTEGRRVIAVTRSADRAAEFQRAGLIPHLADICRPETLADLPPVECVLFAVGYDRTSGHSQAEVMVDGFHHLLNQVAGRCLRIISISSTSVYGQQDGSWVDETSPCDPTQPGGICCLVAENRLQSWLRSVPAATGVILRLAGIYGPGRLLSRVADLQAGRSLAGRADAWLNLIHVDDAVAAVLAAAKMKSPRPVVLVSDDRPVQRGEYYSRLAELVGAPPPTFDPTVSRPRGSGELNKRCSNQRLKSDLGISLTYPSFESGLPAALSAR